MITWYLATADSLPFLSGQDGRCGLGSRVCHSCSSSWSIELDARLPWPPRYHLACLCLFPHLNWSLLHSCVQIKTNFTHIPFMVPGDLHVSTEGSMEGGHYLRIPRPPSPTCTGFATGGPRSLKAEILTGAAPAGARDPVRAC